MTDNTLRNEQEHAPQQHAGIDEDRNLWSRNPDGGWLKHKRPSTGDSEKDLLLGMAMPEFEQILKDPDHPSYDKAQELSVDLAKRIAWTLRPWGVVHPEVRKQFFGFLSDPNAASWFLRHTPSSRRGFAQHFELSLPRFLLQGVDFAIRSFEGDTDLSESENSKENDLDLETLEKFENAFAPSSVPARGAPVIAHVVGWEQYLETSRRTMLVMEQISATHEQWRCEFKQAADESDKKAEHALELSKEANLLAKEANDTAQSKLIVSVLALVVSVAAAVAALIAVLQ